MGRVNVPCDDGSDDLEVCDQCGYILDGVRNCGYCGEPKCPICGCFCGDTPGEIREDIDEIGAEHIDWRSML